MREKPSSENINCQKSVKNINNRRKMHQNRKKTQKPSKIHLTNIKNHRKRMKKRQKHV